MVKTRQELEALERHAHEVRLYRWCSLAFPEVYPQDVSRIHADLSQTIAASLEKN